MKKFLLSLMLVLTLVVCFFSTGCGSKKNEIVIGMSGPLTGGAAVYGVAVKNSAEMAVEEINANGGLNGYTFKLVALDDMHDATKVSTNYASLLQSGMQVSLGCVTTKPALEFSELSKEDNVFFITPSATNDNVPKYSNGYQMCFSDNRQGKFSALYVNENISKATKIGILYHSGDDYSEGIYREFVANIDKAFDVTVASFSEEDPTDLSSQVNLLKDCEFIFLPIYYGPASIFMTQGKETIKANAIYFGCDGLDGIDSAIPGFDITKIPQEVSYLSHFNSKATSGPAKEYIDKYVNKYGIETLNQFGASAYDCVYAIYNALKQAISQNPESVTPSTTPAELCETLKAIFQGGFTFSGITGSNIKWDENGFVDKAAVKYVVKEANK